MTQNYRAFEMVAGYMLTLSIAEIYGNAFLLSELLPVNIKIGEICIIKDS
ncbi:MAG: hypothetical protein BWY02_01484 [bacterium ADurb.Bin157]|nr:MAG: hypothetical protein BWY02_01484 [bacterium ADurb.Bin157]